MRWCRCFVISIGATLAFTVGCCAGQDMRDDSNPDAVPGIGTYNVRQEIQGLVKRLFSRVNSKDLNSLMECFWNSPDIAYLQFRLMGSFLLAGVIPPSCSMNKFGHGFISFIVSTMLTIAAFPAIGQQSEATSICALFVRVW